MSVAFGDEIEISQADVESELLGFFPRQGPVVQKLISLTLG